MPSKNYDVIVVGARCAGSPISMLIARRGYDVLVVDRATFPSDTISTHLIHPPGLDALQRWGLLERVVATGCPRIHTYAFDLGPFVIEGAPGHAQSPVSYAPRRTVLDKLLVDAAAEAGAEVREGFTVDEILIDDGRVTGIRGHDKAAQSVTERARVVIGADGINSFVARSVGAEQYNEKPRLEASYYSYWSGLPMNGRFEGYDRGDRAFAAWSTNDDLTLVIVGPTSPMSKGTITRSSSVRRCSKNASAALDARIGSTAWQCRTSSASRSVRDGHSWVMPATTATSSRPRGSAMRFATPSCARMRCTTRCPAPAVSTRP
jgi:2-polyprenyl-6-methoxyphenol hydroxylase-like FAD-dependent oxidoreductase